MFIQISENRYMNSSFVTHVITTPTNNTLLVSTVDKDYTVDRKYLTSIKAALDTAPNFYGISNWGFLNLSKIKSIRKASEEKFMIQYVEGANDFVLSKENMPDLPTDFLEKVIAWKEGTEITGDGEVADDPKPAVEFTLNPATGDVKMGETKKVTIEGLTEGATIEVESKNTDKATVQKSDFNFTITPVAEGAFSIDVTCKKSGYTDTKKTYTGTVQPAGA